MTKYTGLTEEQVIENRRTGGENLLAEPPGKPWWSLLLEKLREPLMLILALAAFVSMATGGIFEGAGILMAIVLSAGIGFLSEYRAGRAFDILNRTEDRTPVRTYRSGKLVNIPKSQLVCGDVITIETGDEVPADCTVLESNEFHVDQSKFTGEPEPVLKVQRNSKSFAELAVDSTYPPDSVLRSSTVLSGRAVLEITAVGMKTEMGKTARAATEITDETTPLQKQLFRLGKVIAIFGITLSILLFCVLLYNLCQTDKIGLSSVLEIFMVAVTLIVVTVPEGLPMSVTLSLACSMRRMAKNNCLIRKLHASETIGCATVICTDKTGTLTMNRMTLAERFMPSGNDALADESICVNSTANLSGEEVLGNPTEGALLRDISRRGTDFRAVRDSEPFERQWSFTTETKFMATLTKKGRLHVKGAPEVVLGKCAFVLEVGGVQPLSDEARTELLRRFAEQQAKGRRTLAFAYSDECRDPSHAETLVFLGFAAISDPVRPEVPDSIKACRSAGIDVKIVTGDTSATAGEIGREIGLCSGTVTEGRAFEALSPDATEQCVKKLSIIARARPNDKMKLVNTLKKLGEVVAVTGDGTNDAPALHHADVGIAMGRTGTAIAREAADIILLDDSFPSIVNAVLWGRSIYLNIQRFLVFQLTINVAAAGIAIAGPFLGIQMPFTVIQMLWINLIMDSFAALALATEPPTPEVMKRPPRRPGAFIITRKMALTIAGTALLFIVAFFAVSLKWKAGGLDNRESTIIFTAFVFLQLWNLLNVRAFGSTRSMLLHPPKNPVFLWIVIGVAAVQVLITQFGGKVFRTVPLSARDWLILAAVTSLVFWAGEIWRFFQRKFFRNRVCK